MVETYQTMKNGHTIRYSGFFPGKDKSTHCDVTTYFYDKWDEEKKEWEIYESDFIGTLYIYNDYDKYEVSYTSKDYQTSFRGYLHKKKPKNVLSVTKMNGYYTYDTLSYEDKRMATCILNAIEKAHFDFKKARSEEELAPKTLWEKIMNFFRSDRDYVKTYVESIERKEYKKWRKLNERRQTN